MKPIFKSSLILLLLFCLSTTTYGASYYFSTSIGNDSRSASEAQNPNTPWKTINKLNSFFTNLRAGDVVYFRRGETYIGTIMLNASGTSSNPIRLSAYGSGSKPIITSLVEVSGWRGIGNGRYESTNSFSSNDVSIVVVDDKVQEKGRFPNASDENNGYLTINSVNGTRSISSNNLTSSPSFNGGEVVIRKVQWIIDRHPITSHSGSTIEYTGTSSFPPSLNYGFFIQNHINTLDQFGEWFYNRSTKKLNVFFGSSDPSSHKTYLSTLDHLLTKSSSSSNIVLENLHFRGSNKDAITIDGGSGIKFLNNDVEFAGENGFYITSILNLELNNNRVSYAMNNGIYLRFGNPSAKVTNNIVENSFVLPGAGQSGNNNGVGIFAASDGTVVENNQVINTGYNGIHFNGNGTKIKNNLVDGYCILKNDGGGIYSFGGQNTTSLTGREVEGNIVLNGLATNFGTPYAGSRTYKPHASGIFLDDNVSGVNVFNNTVAHTNYTGIKIANGRNITVNNNTFYDTDLHVLLGNSGNGGDTRNITVTNNVLFSKNPDQTSFAIRSSKDDIAQFGNFDNNFFSRPLGDNHSIALTYYPDGKRKDEVLDLQRWQDKFRKDLNSKLFSETIKQFEIIDFKGSSQYTNSTFDSNWNGINCSDCQLSLAAGKLLGNALQIVSPGYSSARVPVKSIKANQNYILSFKAIANKSSTLRAYLRYAGNPWQQISASTTVDIGTSRKEYNILLNSSIDVADAVIMLISDEGNWTYWMDDLEFREANVNVTRPEDVFVFEYNASKSKKRIPLNGTFVDGKNIRRSSSIELEPYTSTVLVKIDGKIETISNTPPSINLTSPSNNSNYSEGNTVNITAQASSETSKIDKVNFYIGNQLIGNTSQSPYSIQWTATPGTHLIKAEAIDEFGLSKSTPQITVFVSEKVEDQEEVVIAPNPENPAPSPNPTPVEGSNDLISVNIGGMDAATYQGTTFVPLSETNISASSFNQSIKPESSDKGIYQTAGFNTNLKFDIPVANGTYSVITYHHEVYFGQSGPEATSGQRVFDITIEGEVVKDDFDMYTESGNQETALKFENIEVTDGILTIQLNASANNAIISAIQVIPNLPETVTPAFSLFINAGSPSQVSHEGNVFVSDYNPPYYSSSNTNENTVSSNIPLFQTHRFSRSLTYSIPVPNGSYKVFTFHKENYFGTIVPEATKGQRVFDIILEGNTVKKDFDMFVESNNRETTLQFENISVTDGFLTLTLNASANQAIVSGIGIVSMQNETVALPTGVSKFINTGSEEAVTFDGYSFASDFDGSYFSISKYNEFSGASSSKLFQSHRFAENLSYKIPVPNGEYTVLTFHNETYFGRRTSSTGPKRRVFDIYLEGELKRPNIDLFMESNNEPIRFEFENIRVNDGILDIDLVASINNATISGIAIIAQEDVRKYTMSNLRQVFEAATEEVMELESEIDPDAITEIKVYPNPAINFATIEIPMGTGNFTVQLLNTSGQLIQSFSSENIQTRSGKYEIPVHQLKQGLYILSIMSDSEVLLRHKLLVNP